MSSEQQHRDRPAYFRRGEISLLVARAKSPGDLYDWGNWLTANSGGLGAPVIPVLDTAISSIFTSRTASTTVTLLLSGLTLHTCVPELSRTIVEEFCGWVAVVGAYTVARVEHLVVPASLVTVARTV